MITMSNIFLPTTAAFHENFQHFVETPKNPNPLFMATNHFQTKKKKLTFLVSIKEWHVVLRHD